MFSSDPIGLGHFNIDCQELMFVQYMPVAFPHMPRPMVPEHLQCFYPLIREVMGRIGDDQYVYLTAKRLFVGPDCIGNRPGWHTDGFGTDDLNYIWYDSLPTEFCIQDFRLSDDHDDSLVEMHMQADPANIKTYPVGSLLLLDSSIVHRPAQPVSEGYRTFVKISVSRHQYNLAGNAHNYLFDYHWPMVPRQSARNHPIGSGS